MDDCQSVTLKEIQVFVFLIICSIFDNIINTSLRGKEKCMTVYKFKNSFSDKKLPPNGNVGIKSLN